MTTLWTHIDHISQQAVIDKILRFLPLKAAYPLARLNTVWYERIRRHPEIQRLEGYRNQLTFEPTRLVGATWHYAFFPNCRAKKLPGNRWATILDEALISLHIHLTEAFDLDAHRTSMTLVTGLHFYHVERAPTDGWFRTKHNRRVAKFIFELLLHRFADDERRFWDNHVPSNIGDHRSARARVQYPRPLVLHRIAMRARELQVQRNDAAAFAKLLLMIRFGTVTTGTFQNLMLPQAVPGSRLALLLQGLTRSMNHGILDGFHTWGTHFLVWKVAVEMLDGVNPYHARAGVWDF